MPARPTRGMPNVVVGVFESSICRLNRFSPARKNLDVASEVVGGVGIQAKISMQQIGIGSIVELAPAQPSLQAALCPAGLERAHIH